MRRAQAALRVATGLDQLAVTWHWQDHQEWCVLWRQGLGPRRITDRLVVTPSWCEAEAPEGAVVVTIDPGMAFGTAEHETTRGALRLMDRALAPGERILDAGCGSAILAISAARLGAHHVLAVDIDPYACEAARDNAAMNGVTDSVEVEGASVTRVWLSGRGPFDGILANIQTEVLVPLLESFARAARRVGVRGRCVRHSARCSGSSSAWFRAVTAWVKVVSSKNRAPFATVKDGPAPSGPSRSRSPPE